MVNSIGIIGFGNFVKFAAMHFSKNFDVFVTDNMNKSLEANKLGVKFVDLEGILKNKILVLAVPMEDLEEIILKISDKILPGTLILDVCSLKVFSCNLMLKHLPKEVNIVGTHPLFGPQSARDSLTGMKIVLCNVRCSKKLFKEIDIFCKSLGLETFKVTPEEHDRQMALSQALTHFIGQVAKRIDLNRVDLSTKTFDDLMDIIEIIKNDTPKLFNNMQQMNPFAKIAREKFVKAAEELNFELNNNVGVKNNG